MIDQKVLDKILSKAMAFIYAGQTERPVRHLNFRGKDIGGLGLIHPNIKAKALLLKNMYREFKKLNCTIEEYEIQDLYGHKDEFIEIVKFGVDLSNSKNIYDVLMQDIILKNNSVVPSRNERRVANVKWSTAWKNSFQLRRIDSEEYEFAWKFQQDMLPVGSRIHRRNVERRCLVELAGGQLCLDVQTREHLFYLCQGVSDVFESVKYMVQDILQKDVTSTKLLHLDFNDRDKRRLKSTLWIAVKALYRIYLGRVKNRAQLLRELVKEIEWNLRMNFQVGRQVNLVYLKEKIVGYNSSI